MKTFYRLDATDRIIEVGGDWDRFALENDGEAALGEKLEGTDVFASISGDRQKMYFRTVLQRARLSLRPIELDYFCHAPHELRHARMTLISDKNGSVLVKHSFVTRQRVHGNARAKPSVFPAAWVSPLKQCLQCGRVRSSGRWVTVDAVELRRGQTLFKGYCETCGPEVLANL